MSIQDEILLVGVGWIAAILLTFRISIQSAAGSVGLPLAYLLATTFCYIGGFSYVFPDYSHERIGGSLYLRSYAYSEHTVLLGMTATFLGLAGFAAGCMLKRGIAGTQNASYTSLLVDRAARDKVLWYLAVLGVLGYVFQLLRIDFPMAQALLQGLRNMGLAATCLGLLYATHDRNRAAFLAWLCVAASPPLIYVVAIGFVSAGFIIFTLLTGFWLSWLGRERMSAIKFMLGAIPITYLMLSLFVAWMSFRMDVRSAESFEDRIDAISAGTQKIEWLTPGNHESLDWLNTRLNQYIFVGKVIEQHEALPSLRLNGESLMYIPLVWVPRAIWPNKPEMGGNAMLSKHAGMAFSATATFGSGPIVELFVNFGYAGILFGSMILGYLVRWIDLRATEALRAGRPLEFTRWFCVGIPFVAPLTEIFFIANSAMMAWPIEASLISGTSRARRGRFRRSRSWPMRRACPAARPCWAACSMLSANRWTAAAPSSRIPAR